MSQATARAKRKAQTNGHVPEPPKPGRTLELTNAVIVLRGLVRDSEGVVVNEVSTDPLPLYGAELDRIAPGVRTELWPKVQIEQEASQGT